MTSGVLSLRACLPQAGLPKQSHWILNFYYIPKMKKSYVYFLTNKSKSVIYVGVTSNLVKRVHQHKLKTYKGFTTKYNCNRLVYFEEYNTISDAIAREKILKSGNRKRKELLINNFNPEWKDLSKDWVFDIN